MPSVSHFPKPRPWLGVHAAAQEMFPLCSSSGWRDSFQIVSRSSQVHLFVECTCSAGEVWIFLKFFQAIQL